MTLVLLAFGLAALTLAQAVSSVSQGRDGKQIRTQAAANPTNLDFGDQVVQTIGKELMVTLTNSSDKPLEIRSFDTAQDGEDFVVDYEIDGCRGAAIDAGKSCKVGVVFYPLIVGERRSFLLITYDDPDNPQKISLRGKGINP